MNNSLYRPDTKSSYLERVEKIKERYTHDISSPVVRNHSEALPTMHLGNYGADEIALYKMLKTRERVEAILYGYSSVGFVLIAATNERIIFIDKKFMYEHIEESTIDSITGVSFEKTLFLIDITLSTRLGDYKVLTFATKRAHDFIRFVESQCIKNAIIVEEGI